MCADSSTCSWNGHERNVLQQPVAAAISTVSTQRKKHAPSTSERTPRRPFARRPRSSSADGAADDRADVSRMAPTACRIKSSSDTVSGCVTTKLPLDTWLALLTALRRAARRKPLNRKGEPTASCLDQLPVLTSSANRR